jgi:hypothetical protein
MRGEEGVSTSFCRRRATCCANVAVTMTVGRCNLYVHIRTELALYLDIALRCRPDSVSRKLLTYDRLDLHQRQCDFLRASRNLSALS